MARRLREGRLTRSAGRNSRRRSDDAELQIFAVELARLLRATTIETLPISSLHPNPRNTRRHSERQIAQLMASVSRFAIVIPILIDETRSVIAGHGRLLAAERIGLTEVPTIQVTHLSESEKRAFAIADNRIAELAEWDIELLKIELEALSITTVDLNVEVTGFDTVDIDKILGAGQNSTTEKDPADTFPGLDEQAAPISKFGDRWELNRHRLLCGDARDADAYSALLGSSKAEMVFADPPYNVPINGHVSLRRDRREFPMASGEMSPHEFRAFLERSFRLMASASDDGAIHFVCMDWRHLSELLSAAIPVYGDPKQLCVWVKDNAGMGTFYRSQHELIFVFKIGTGPHINNFGLGERGRYRTNIWRYPAPDLFNRDRAATLAMHPTVKPVALVVDAIKDCSRRGGIVLDPFAGSGTTLIAAERTGRQARLIEFDPLYVDLTIRRWQAFTGALAVHAGSNRTFDEISRSQEGNR